MHFSKIFSSKYLVLFFLTLLLSGKLIAQTYITSSITIDQAWVNANASHWIISGDDVTVTFSENLELIRASEYFEITGSRVIIDGANKIVTISSVPNYRGLVKANASNASSAEIKNIGLEIVSPTVTSTLNSKDGWISQIDNKADIINCYSTGNITYIGSGGIAGEGNYGAISNCYSTGDILGQFSGGIVGFLNYGAISNCYSSGDILGTFSGGIVGNINDGTITNSYTTGNITGVNAGGISGANNQRAINNCYSSGEISGSSASGIAGANNTGAITDSRSSGSRTGGSGASDIASSGTISNSINITPTIANTWDNSIANEALTGEDGTIWNTTVSPYRLMSFLKLTISLPVASLTSCSGSSSTHTTFGVSGSGLTASVTISAPSDFEISTSSDGFYSISLTLTNTSTVSKTLYVRLSPSATTGAIAGSITATSSPKTASTTVSGTVNAIPSISITEIDASGVDPNDGIICNGASVTLTASGTTSYLWSTGESTTTITKSPTTTATYTVTGTASGCSNTASITITVNAIPSINIAESDASGSSNNDSKVCIGGLATLTASGGATYLWSTLDNTSLINPSPSTNTTYTVTGTTAGCSNTASITITVESLPTLSFSSISLSNESTYLITKTTSVLSNESWTVSGTISVNNGYVTAGTTPGTYTVSYTDGCAQTTSATVTVSSTSTLPAITDGLASYKFNNNPQGPLGSGNVVYMGYNGFNYSSTTRPTKPGFYKANNVSGSSAGSPFEYNIFRCTTCGTVSSFGTRPQGTLSGNTSGTGQLTYTSSNGGGPFTIVYQATGASPVTVSNISSTVAFNVVTPTITTSYKLISVTDESTNASSDFSGTTASIAVPYIVGQAALGGKIAYILQSGDPGYDANVQHGLVATVADIPTVAAWGCPYALISTSTAFGTGNQNTINIMAGCNTAGIAARLCGNLDLEGYDDWYLPSKDELTKLYLNRVAIGGFVKNAVYWSSSAPDVDVAWYRYFALDSEAFIDMTYSFNVRAIRSF